MKKPFFLMIMALALIAGASAGIFTADANDGPQGVTWYANSPSGLSPSGQDTGTALRKFVDALPGVGPANRNTPNPASGSTSRWPTRIKRPTRAPIIM